MYRPGSRLRQVGNRCRAMSISTGFNPLSLSPVLFLSPAGPFYGDLGTTLVSANGSAVRRWADISGNARHADAPSDSARPTLTIASGKTYLTCDGVDDRLRISDFSSAFTTSGTIAWVSSNPSTGMWTITATEWQTTNNGGYDRDTNGKSYPHQLRSQRAQGSITYPALSSGKTTVIIRSQANSYRRRVNGSEDVSANDSTNIAGTFSGGTTWRVGCAIESSNDTRFFPGSVACLLAFDRILADDECTQLESWMGGLL